MKNHLPTKTAKRLAITSIGKTFTFAIFSLLLLTAANTNFRGQSVDSFNPNVNQNTFGRFPIETIVRQTDGKVLIGDYFITVGGQPRNKIARVNADGTLDTTFTSPLGNEANTVVSAIAL